jgi:hypothetical protein
MASNFGALKFLTATGLFAYIPCSVAIEIGKGVARAGSRNGVLSLIELTSYSTHFSWSPGISLLAS